MRIYLLLAMAVGASFIGSNCGGSGVGDPCVPEDEYLTTFSGFSAGEVNVESRSFQCLTRVCLVNHFQGRVSCPYGQPEDPDLPTDNGRSACAAQVVSQDPPVYACNEDAGSKCADATCQPGGALHRTTCRVPDRDGAQLEDRIQVPVQAQLHQRQAHEAVYCSCRCDGPDPNARYCECPSGFTCEELVDDLGLGKGQLAGSYCVKDGTSYVASEVSADVCDDEQLCGPNCDGCAERNEETGECEEQIENLTLSDCASVDVVVAGEIQRQPRNFGGACEGTNVVCDDDTLCCQNGPTDAEGNVTEAVRVPCSEVGVAQTLNDGTTVTTCP